MSEVGQRDLKRRLEKNLEELPVLPAVVVNLMSLDTRADDYFDQVLEIIRSEPNFSTRILALANSAANASQSPITTLNGALSRIGSQGAANLLLALSVTRVFVPGDAWEKSLWRHAIQVAIAARELAVACADPAVPPDVAYACGLLHDLGRFVMFQEAPEDLRRIDEGDWDDPTGLIEMERSICGLTHSELGAIACARWNLPETIGQVIRDHHFTADELPDDGIARLTTVIRVADLAMFPSAMALTTGLEDEEDAVLQDTVLAHLPPSAKISVSELRKLLRTVMAEADATIVGLGLDL